MGTVSITMAQQLKKPVKNNRIPSSYSTSVGASASCSSGLPVHPTRTQHPSFPSPAPGMGQPTAQLPTLWWVPGVHLHLRLHLTPMAMGTIITGSNWAQSHTSGLNNSNSNLGFHQQHQNNNRSVNKLEVWGHHQPLLCPQQHTRICQTMLAVKALWQNKMMLLIC